MPKILTALALIAFALVGCSFQPEVTPRQIATADYGTYPNDLDGIVKAHLNKALVDPYSVRDLEIGTPQRAYTLRTDYSPAGVFGYAVRVSFNSKNRMGGYVGNQDEVMFVRNGQVLFMADWIGISVGLLKFAD